MKAYTYKLYAVAAEINRATPLDAIVNKFLPLHSPTAYIPEATSNVIVLSPGVSTHQLHKVIHTIELEYIDRRTG